MEANLVRLNESARLPFIDSLIDRKLAGAEKSVLPEADLAFHEARYQRLRQELETASRESSLPDQPAGKQDLHDLLLRLRLNGAECTRG